MHCKQVALANSAWKQAAVKGKPERQAAVFSEGI